MKGNTVSARRFFICNILIYIAMYPASLFFLVFLSILPLQEAFKLYFNAAGLTSLLFVVFVPPLLYFRVMKKLTLFRQNQLSVEEVNKAVKIYELASMVLPVASPLIQPFFMCRLYGAYKIPFLTPSIILIFVAATFLFSLFFYILYIQAFEKYISFVPLLEKYRSMPLVVRSILVGLFSFTAVTALFVAPLLVPLRSGSGIDASLIERIIILAVCGSLIGVGDIYLQINGASNRVKRIMAFTADVAAGNYRCDKLEVTSRDEFGLLINDLNLFYDNTKSLLGNLGSNIEISKAAADELAKSMNETEQSLGRISDSIADVASQVSRQSEGAHKTQNAVEGITGNISRLNENIDKQAVQVAQSSAAIEEMVANVQSVTGIVEKNMKTVSSLGQAAEAGKTTVGDTVQITRRMIGASEGLLETSVVIQNIATQTNLLAMNAAIEAAHAGDVGAGFAVVADEIRKLAEDSNQQGKTITAVMKELIEEIHEVDSSANAVQKEFEDIAVLTDAVENQERVVINAMQEQCSAGGQVLEAIRRMNEITAEVKNGSGQMMEGSAAVASEMRGLVEITEKITQSARVMSGETTQIQRQMENVSETSKKNAAGMSSVAQEMGRFKI